MSAHRWTWQRSETEHRLHEEYDDGRPPLLILRAKTTHAGKIAPPLRSNEELIASLPEIIRERDTYKAQRDALAGALYGVADQLHDWHEGAGDLDDIEEYARAALAGMERAP